MRIVIVDDDPIVRMSLKTILSEKLEVAGVGCCCEDAVQLYFTHKPDLILLDIRMGSKTGLTAASEILSRDKKAKVLFLTTFTDEEYLSKAIEIGACGYILKQDFESIFPALEAAMTGHKVFGCDVVKKIMTKADPQDFYKYGLSNKDVEIMQLVADGKSNKEIANSLFLSEGTIRNYLSAILEKLNLRDRTQLAVFYYKH